MMAEHLPTPLQVEVDGVEPYDAPRPIASNLRRGGRPRAAAQQQHMRHAWRPIRLPAQSTILAVIGREDERLAAARERGRRDHGTVRLRQREAEHDVIDLRQHLEDTVLRHFRRHAREEWVDLRDQERQVPILNVDDADGAGSQGRGDDIGEHPGQRPSWPPGLGDADGWERFLRDAPDLEPAVRRGADGLAHRVDRLRLCGNGVVPLVAAHALRTLAAELLADG
jgi:hypothetical protein